MATVPFTVRIDEETKFISMGSPILSKELIKCPIEIDGNYYSINKNRATGLWSRDIINKDNIQEDNLKRIGIAIGNKIEFRF